MNQFSEIYNCWWLMIISMTTVGYGDIAPLTHISRLITMMACIAGNFTLQLITISMALKVDLNNRE